MPNNNKNIKSILLDNGMIFPETPQDVSRFFKCNEYSKSEFPSDWEKPLEIIKRGRKELNTNKVININLQFNKELSNLAMVAREGKSIPSNILNKMKEDKKNAKK